MNYIKKSICITTDKLSEMEKQVILLIETGNINRPIRTYERPSIIESF